MIRHRTPSRNDQDPSLASEICITRDMHLDPSLASQASGYVSQDSTAERRTQILKSIAWTIQEGVASLKDLVSLGHRRDASDRRARLLMHRSCTDHEP